MKMLSEFKFFTELAPEIRNRVYELLLKEDHEIVFDKRQTPVVDLENLALVNKQISDEARSLYFSINNFRLESHFQSTDQSARFLRILPTSCVSQVKHLTINTFM
ncbi:hypothetical protein BDZ45DRAFT_682133 [Acephala macrosclerotiorum]|nr:hypothetical protein BDZ45DRAFT_682133 [Acephala macrosclerotiorum]